MAAAVALPARTSTPQPHLSINTTSRGTPAPVPNKHIPVCSPGPKPERTPDTPPASPPTPSSLASSDSCLLYPPTRYRKIAGGSSDEDLPLYELSATELTEAMTALAQQALPDPRQVFPWLHGLHAENQIQLAFFTARKKALRRTPNCLRGITIVKAGGDLNTAKLRGTVAPQELLKSLPSWTPRSPGVDNRDRLTLEPDFQDIDPKEGFSVRNFHIQTCKWATLSDIVVYGDDNTSKEQVMKLARQIATAQRTWSARSEGATQPIDEAFYNTFIVTDSFEQFEKLHPDMVAVNSQGLMTGEVMDFFHWERLEMFTMSSASEICNNVWLGPTPDPNLDDSEDDDKYDVLIECTDLASPPDATSLASFKSLLDRDPSARPLQLEFPSSGSIMPPTWSQTEVDSLLATCSWIYSLANPDDASSTASSSSTPSIEREDADGDSIMLTNLSTSQTKTARRVLIHCTDGYTESTLLAMTYFMFANGLPVSDAWLQLHCDKNRNFFAYPSDVALLTSIQPRILCESPHLRKLASDGRSMGEPTSFSRHDSVLTPDEKPDLLSLCSPHAEPAWLSRMDGSLPSRILPYMYLGNLGHANNPELLRELGIRRVLSVGEPVLWARTDAEGRAVGEGLEVLFIDRVQDNGVDALTEEFEKCLAFIEQGKSDGMATLVHCRVGVSRSATICIAEVMKEMALSFPRAYCFVRARRLNVIIQPHLRFVYELLKWEEYQCTQRNKPVQRELEWATIAREIALMNKPYSRQ